MTRTNIDSFLTSQNIPQIKQQLSAKVFKSVDSESNGGMSFIDFQKVSTYGTELLSVGNNGELFTIQFSMDLFNFITLVL